MIKYDGKQRHKGLIGLAGLLLAVVGGYFALPIFLSGTQVCTIDRAVAQEDSPCLVQQATISAQDVMLLQFQLTGTAAAVQVSDLRTREAELLATIDAFGAVGQAPTATVNQLESQPATETPRPTIRPTSTPVVTAAIGNGVDLVQVISPGVIASEAVVLRSQGGDIDMTGWLLEDSSGNRYTFPQATLRGGSTLTVYTGVGEDSDTALYWGRDEAVWNRSGDTLILRNRSSLIAIRATIFERR